MAADLELERELAEVLRCYEALWDKQDASLITALWDQDDPEPFYLAEEQDDWRVGWDDVKDYLGPPGRNKTSEAMRMRFHGIQAKLLAPDLAFASFWIRFDAKMNFLPKPIGNDSRASAVFRKKPAGWRLVAWTEAPQSPLLYMQKLYEMNVHPQFAAFRKTVAEDGSE